MEIKETQAAIEAVLFASGEPVPAARLAQALSIDVATVDKLVRALAGKTRNRTEWASGIKTGKCLSNVHA